MHVDAASGAEHLLRAARDVALPDAEIERRVAAKNAVVARALRERRLSLAEAEHLLYDPHLLDHLADRRPGCTFAGRILRLGCSLTGLGERLLKWSPEHPRLCEERIALLVDASDRVLAPEALIESFRRRPALSLDELELALSLADSRLVPVFLRTLFAETCGWSEGDVEALREGALAGLGAGGSVMEPLSVGEAGLLPPVNGGPDRVGRPLKGPAGAREPASAGFFPCQAPRLRGAARDYSELTDAWLSWWQRDGRFAYSDPVDTVSERPHRLLPPVALLPEGGGEYTLDPPRPFYYEGRHLGRSEIFFLRPRERQAGGWRSRLTGAVEAILAGSAASPAEFVGACGLDGGAIHPCAPGEAIRVSIPDPQQSIAWLGCSECGQAGYVRYALDADALPAGSIG